MKLYFSAKEYVNGCRAYIGTDLQWNLEVMENGTFNLILDLGCKPRFPRRNRHYSSMVASKNLSPLAIMFVCG